MVMMSFPETYSGINYDHDNTGSKTKHNCYVYYPSRRSFYACLEIFMSTQRPVLLNGLRRGNGLDTFDMNTYTFVQLHAKYAPSCAWSQRKIFLSSTGRDSPPPTTHHTQTLQNASRSQIWFAMATGILFAHDRLLNKGERSVVDFQLTL